MIWPGGIVEHNVLWPFVVVVVVVEAVDEPAQEHSAIARAHRAASAEGRDEATGEGSARADDTRSLVGFLSGGLRQMRAPTT